MKLKLGGFIILLLLVLLIVTSEQSKVNAYDDMVMVSTKSQEAFQIIRDYKLSHGINSPHESGMLGQDFTWITTTLGSKESKTTAANPNFAAVIYVYVKQLDLEQGDHVAVNLSGSFPSLDIMTIIILEHMGLIPVIQSSIGASTYGANDPELTYIDMENLLLEKGIIESKSILFTNGGHNDTGSDMDETILTEIILRLESLGYTHYYEDDLELNIETRMTYFDETKALINVGGNMVSQTKTDLGYFDQHGYLSSTLRNTSTNGLIGRFLSSNRDVIHLLDIKAIALERGLPIDPVNPQVGEGQVYVTTYYDFKIIVLIWAVALISILGEYNDRRIKEKNAVEGYLSA
jgi:poly-gamma-glutamate system protein